MPDRREKRRVRAAEVILWGKPVGAVAWNGERGFAEFEFARSYLKEGAELSPLLLPKRPGIFSFPALSRETFRGLPGLLADSLPDRFGNALIDAWLARQGRPVGDFTPVERLCYVGSRGMGALEYRPALRPAERKAVPIEVERLIGLAQLVLDERTDLLVHLKDDEKALETILRTGTSAGGARAKALIALNRRTREIRSGQVPPPPGFEPWILKFDGVVDRGLGEPIGFGRIEYAYHLMARRAGIGMAECELLEEGGRAHFMTKRFDRTETGGKLHMQSLCALAHLDFNLPGAFAYEEAFGVIQRLNLGHRALEEMFRRMVFNVVARNQDDHTKNIAFLMSREGEWSLAPAFDVMWAYNPGGPWTREHQMSINGRRDGFTLADLLAPAGMFGVKRGGEILDRVVEAVRGWEGTAKECGVLPAVASQIGATHRLSFPP